MKQKISKRCLEYILKGLNCEFNTNLKIKQVKNKLIIIDEKNLDNFEKSLHLEIENGNEIKFKIHNIDENSKNTFQKLFENFKNTKFLDNLIEIIISEDEMCSFTGISVKIICKIIKAMKIGNWFLKSQPLF